MPKSKNYQSKLLDALRDPEEAAEYLNAALEEGDRELFLLTLRNVTNAQGGFSKLADTTELNRESLYRMLSEKGNPEFYSLNALLDALGFRLAVELKPNELKSKNPEREEVEILVFYPRKDFESQSSGKFALAADTKVEPAEKTVIVNSDEQEIGELKYDFQRGQLFLDNFSKQMLPNWPSIDLEIRTKDGKQHKNIITLGTDPTLILLQGIIIKRDEIKQITMKPHQNKNKA